MKVLLILLVSLVAVVPLAAQDVDLSETFVFDSGAAFDLPEGREVTSAEDYSGLIYFDMGDDHLFSVADFSLFEAEGFAAGDDLVDAMDWFITFFFEGTLELNRDDVEQITLDEREAIRLPYTDDIGNRALMVAVRFDDGTFGIVDAFAAEADFAGDDLLLAIATTFNSGDGSLVAGGTAATTEDVVPCVVSTAQSNTVQLRVGPGTNRTVYAFLPANRDFTPLGRAEADDGSLWFQMDKDEVAPNAAASEAWIAVEAVETSGDCDSLGESTAPPIVPMAPVAPPASGGDGGGSEGSTGSSEPTGDSIAPSPGTWTVNYAATGKGSCLDAADFTYDFNVDWSPDVVSLSYNGSSVVMSGSRLNRIQPNVYSGIFTLSNGHSLQMTISPVSSTMFTGQAMLTGVVDGHTCSNTVGVTVTRN